MFRLFLVPLVLLLCSDFGSQEELEALVIIDRQNLTSKMAENVFTIEFHGDPVNSMNNETSRRIFYATLRDTILDYLNAKRKATLTATVEATTATTTTSIHEATDVTGDSSTTTSPAATTATTTTSQPTTITATTITTTSTTTPAPEETSPPPRIDPSASKRKKRSSSSSSSSSAEEDYAPDSISFLQLPQHVHNDTLYVTLTLDEISEGDLREALQSIKDKDVLFKETQFSVRTFYEGFPAFGAPATTDPPPPERGGVSSLWFVWVVVLLVILVILVAVLLLFCCCRKKRSVAIEQAALQDSRFNSSPGKTQNSIVDGDGWIVPMDEFTPHHHHHHQPHHQQQQQQQHHYHHLHHHKHHHNTVLNSSKF